MEGEKVGQGTGQTVDNGSGFGQGAGQFYGGAGYAAAGYASSANIANIANSANAASSANIANSAGSADSAARPAIGSSVLGGAAMRDREFTNDEILSLLWPKRLIATITSRRDIRLWSTPLAVVNFVLALILGVLLGPLQLILLALTGDYNYITSVYYPNTLSVSMILTGLIAVSVAVCLVQVWREQPRRAVTTVILSFGSLLISAVIWLAAYAINFDAASLTLVMVLLIAGVAIAAVSTSRKFYSTEQKHTWLGAFIILGVLGSAVEAGCAFVYLFTQSGNAESSQQELESLALAQTAARSEGVSAQLSDLVFTLCGGAYTPVYLPTYEENTGLFSCSDSSEVYSVSGPLTSETTNSDRILLGSAYYFGKTRDAQISTYFPVESGAKYLYRDLADDTSGTAMRSLILLLPAASEEILVNGYLDALTNLVNNLNVQNLESRQDISLKLSIFYAPELNTVVNTRDFILLAAADTLELDSYLPRGTSYQGYLNGGAGTYIFYSAKQLPALSELALSPLLYSSQTRQAITDYRHITLTLDGLQHYTPETLRELLYQNFREPSAATTSGSTDAESTAEPAAADAEAQAAQAEPAGLESYSEADLAAAEAFADSAAEATEAAAENVAEAETAE